MESKLLFRETQRFRTWWLWALFLVVSGVLVFRVVVDDNPLDANGMLGLAIAFALTGLVVGLFSVMKLDTEIRTDGIYVRFYPFHLRFRHHPWRSLQDVRVRKYSPLFEYGGWGLRGLGNNRALNVSGNTGIQLVTTRRKKLLIGTQKPREAAEAIAKVYHP